eukprot:GHVL01033288.1.p2 GENE.GHVL01033288.1~~GHVL01033288.1.p2  ORF type:complete len:105 (+),score=3.14 GHVL01033288.1:27-341(+)
MMMPTAKQLEKGGIYVVLAFAIWFGVQVYEDNKLERAQDKEFYASVLAEISDDVKGNTSSMDKIITLIESDLMEHVYTNRDTILLRTPVNDGRQPVEIPIKHLD